MELGTQIKTLRKVRGITQQRLADTISASLMSVRRWESGYVVPGKGGKDKEPVQPSVRCLKEIASALEVPIGFFFDESVSEYNFKERIAAWTIKGDGAGISDPYSKPPVRIKVLSPFHWDPMIQRPVEFIQWNFLKPTVAPIFHQLRFHEDGRLDLKSCNWIKGLSVFHEYEKPLIGILLDPPLSWPEELRLGELVLIDLDDRDFDRPKEKGVFLYWPQRGKRKKAGKWRDDAIGILEVVRKGGKLVAGTPDKRLSGQELNPEWIRGRVVESRTHWWKLDKRHGD